MSYPVPIQQITSTATFPVEIGPANAYGALVIYNESLNTLTVTAGSKSMWLPAWTGDKLDVLDSGWGGGITITPQNLSSAANPPSAFVAITAYGVSEPISGTFPVALSRVNNIGNGTLNTTTANAVIVSGETPPNDLVKASPTGYAGPVVDLKDDGTLLIAPNANNVQTNALQIIPGGASSATLIKLDNGKIATDGAGGFSCYSVTGLNGTLPISAQLNGAGPYGVYFQSWNGVGIQAPFSVGGQFGGAQSWISTSGLVLGGGASPYGQVSSLQSGGATGLLFNAWNGSAAVYPLSVGGQFNGAVAFFASTGQLNHPALPIVSTADAKEQIGFAMNTGTEVGAASDTNVVSLNSGNVASGVVLKGNAYYNGTFDIFYTSNPASSLLVYKNNFKIRISTNASPTAGSNVSWSSQSSIPGASKFGGTGSGTFSHGLGITTPNYIGITSTESNSTMTVGVDTIGSSSVHVNTANAWPWIGLASVQ